VKTVLNWLTFCGFCAFPEMCSNINFSPFQRGIIIIISVDSTKYVGLIPFRKLHPWLSHIKVINAKYLYALDAFKYLSYPAEACNFKLLCAIY